MSGESRRGVLENGARRLVAFVRPPSRPDGELRCCAGKANKFFQLTIGATGMPPESNQSARSILQHTAA
ncbi:hypothetical protein E2C01_085383 [Portunus trituberculatus]|uniref:Uncharacterized protein n=1 Tax=Portunus trituberculatus TaxID=210409 RepID=A0A5B7JBS2_PORTR|nr:hypothetical protein [Portunus trituberculatus]